jgi:hypothetical protein
MVREYESRKRTEITEPSTSTQSHRVTLQTPLPPPQSSGKASGRQPLSSPIHLVAQDGPMPGSQLNPAGLHSEMVRLRQLYEARRFLTSRPLPPLLAIFEGVHQSPLLE